MTAAAQAMEWIDKHGGAVLQAVRLYEEGWLVMDMPDVLCADWHADGPALAWALPDMHVLKARTMVVDRVVVNGIELQVVGAPAGGATTVLHLSPLWTPDWRDAAATWARVRGPNADRWRAAVVQAAEEAAGTAPSDSAPLPLHSYGVQGIARFAEHLQGLVDAGAWAVALDGSSQWAVAPVLGWTGLHADLDARVVRALDAGLTLADLQDGLARRGNGVTASWALPEVVRAPSPRTAALRWLRKHLGDRYPGLVL